MVFPSWNRIPAGYDEHHRAGPKDWHASKARALSRRKAQYNPIVATKEQWIKLELDCIEACVNPIGDKQIPAMAITDLHDPKLKQHKFCLDCRVHFNDDNFTAGYCSEEPAHFILVKWCSSGEFHGQPATLEHVKKLGAAL